MPGRTFTIRSGVSTSRHLATLLLMFLMLGLPVAAQNPGSGWIVLGAPAPYRSQLTYIRDGLAVYSMTCNIGAPRTVQQWVGNQPVKQGTRTELVSNESRIRIDMLDHTRSPKSSFHSFKENGQVQLSGSGANIPPFRAGDFLKAYREFHKSCQRGVSIGPVSTYNCGIPENNEARTVCRHPELARMQRATIERYEQVTRGLATVDEGLEAWRRYIAHIDQVETCKNDRTGACYQAAYQARLSELGALGAPGGEPLKTLAAPVADSHLETRLAQHGLSQGRALGRIDELQFILAKAGNRDLAVVLHDVPADQDIQPGDERLLRGLALLADKLTPPASLTLFHFVEGHPVPVDSAGEANVAEVAISNVAVTQDRKAGSIVTRFVSTDQPVSAAALLAQADKQIALTQEYTARSKAELKARESARQVAFATTERDKASRAAQSGQVYKNPEFWSGFTRPEAQMLFEGQYVRPTTSLRYLAGWLAAKAKQCAPFDAPSHEVVWPDGPLIRQILAAEKVANAFPDEPVLVVQDVYAELFSIIAKPALLTKEIVARSVKSTRLAERMVGPERDAARLLRMSGCDSATASQFEINMVRSIHGSASILNSGPQIENAREESDAPPD